MITFSEFEKTCYHTQYNIVIPLVNRMQNNKLAFYTKDNPEKDKLSSQLMYIYEEIYKKSYLCKINVVYKL